MDGWMDACMDAWMHGCMDAWHTGTAARGNRPSCHTGYPLQAATNSPMPRQTHEAHSLDSSGSSNATTCGGTSSGVHTSFLHSSSIYMYIYI